jgi:hypothetical protein
LTGDLAEPRIQAFRIPPREVLLEAGAEASLERPAAPPPEAETLLKEAEREPLLVDRYERHQMAS